VCITIEATIDDSYPSCHEVHDKADGTQMYIHYLHNGVIERIGYQ
jgi:hypothetical protein